MLQFELPRNGRQQQHATRVVERRVQSLPVVKDLDEVEYGLPALGPHRRYVAAHRLGVQGEGDASTRRCPIRAAARAGFAGSSLQLMLL